MNPPTFDASKVISSRYRFESSAALSRTAISAQDLLDLLCFATGATAAYQICSAVRLRSVRLWGPMASNLSPVTVSVEYNSQASGAPTMVLSDTSMGSMKAAVLSFPPPSGSLASFWQTNSGSALFYLTGPTGTIVDITLDQVIQNGQTAQAVGASVSGATVGTVYLRALDSNGSAQLPPVSYLSI